MQMYQPLCMFTMMVSRAKKDILSCCMERSRGGLTTKLHAVIDLTGKPVCLKLAAGRANDGRSAQDVFGRIDEGTVFLADSDYLRAKLKRRGAIANIKPLPNRKGKPGRQNNFIQLNFTIK